MRPERHRVARIGRVGGVEHFQQQLRARQVALRTAAFERQFGADLVPAIPLGADQAVVGYKHVVEGDLVEVMLADLVDDRADGHPRRLHVHQQLRHAGVALLAAEVPVRTRQIM